MSDYMIGVREARLNMWHRRQQEEFERNAFRRQKIHGVFVCAIAIIIQALLNDIWWALETAPVLAAGLYLIGTERRWL